MSTTATDMEFSGEYTMSVDEVETILFQFIKNIDMECNAPEIFEMKVKCGLYFMNKYVDFADYEWRKGGAYAIVTEYFIPRYKNYGLFGINPTRNDQDNRIKKCMDTILDFLKGKNQSEMRLLMSVDFWNKPKLAIGQGGILRYVQDKIAKYDPNYRVSQDEIKKAIESISGLNTKKICYMGRRYTSSEKST